MVVVAIQGAVMEGICRNIFQQRNFVGIFPKGICRNPSQGICRNISQRNM